MRRISFLSAAALFAIALLAPAGSADLPGDASRSFRASVVLESGGREVVLVLGTSEEGLVTQDGTARETIAWGDIKAASAYDVMRKAADNRHAPDWLWIGIKMLERDEDALAERAFTVAERLDETTGTLAKRARMLHREGRDPRNALGSGPIDEEAAPERHVDKQRETRRSKADEDAKWPVLSEEERREAIAGTRAWAEERIARGGQRMTASESEHYIVYTKGGANTGRRIAASLEGMHRTLKGIFKIPDETVMYHGKCTVVILDSKAEFVDFEDKVFGNDAEKYGGFHHGSETYSMVVSFTQESPQALESLLVHETTHAFMHRYRTRYRLPTWANEGLADYISGYLVTNFNRAERNWNTARTYVMNGHDPADIMAQDYGSGWNDDENSYPVSHMIVRYMITYKAPEFRAWIDDIKDGKQWVEAMVDRFSPSPDRPVTPDVLARGFIEQMKSERTYQR